MGGHQAEGLEASPHKVSGEPSPASTSLISTAPTLSGDLTAVVAQHSPENSLSSSRHESPDASIDAMLKSSFFSPNSKFFQDRDTPEKQQRQLVLAETPARDSRWIPTQPSSQYKSRNNAAFGKNYNNGNSGYRSSKTWYSPENQRYHDYLVIRNAMRRLFKKAEVAKWSYDDYIKHLEAMLASKKAYLAKVLAAKEQERVQKQRDEGKVWHPEIIARLEMMGLPYHNASMQGNISRVLGEKTIWCHDWRNGKDEIADWPTLAEMKWEGDDRAKTGVGRFPPLPRERGPPSIAWNQLAIVEQYPLDEVARIPTLEDVLLPVDEIPEEDTNKYIPQDIMDAIDDYLES